MLTPIFRDAIIFASLTSLMSVGLTLIYITTKISNFAHGSLETIGVYLALTMSSVWQSNPYYSLPLAFLFGGAASLILYLLILRPLTRRGASSVSLMVATLAFDLILLAILNIYADHLTSVYKISSRAFILRGIDFKVADQPGIFLVAPTLVLTTISSLYIVLTRTKFGIAMRAVAEDPRLAGVMGVNINLVFATSWFLSGGLAAIAGVLLPLWFMVGPDTGTSMMLSVFAASIVGGFSSIYGAALGGYLVGLTEILVTNFLAQNVGSWMISYRPAIPLLAIVVTLLIAPTGVAGIDWSSRIRWIRVRLFGSAS